jgi:hypothetical protein
MRVRTRALCFIVVGLMAVAPLPGEDLVGSRFSGRMPHSPNAERFSERDETDSNPRARAMRSIPANRKGPTMEKDGPKSGGRSGGGASSSSGEAPAINFPPNAARLCLHFAPMDLSVPKDSNFDVALVLENSAGKSFDSLRIVLDFDPQRIAIMTFDTAPLTDLLASDAEDGGFAVERQAASRMLFDIRLNKTLSPDRMRVMNFRFKAIGAPGSTFLRLSGGSKESGTAIWLQGVNQMGDGNSSVRGVIDTNVFIVKPKVDEEKRLEAIASGAALSEEDRMTQDGWPIQSPDSALADTAWVDLQGPEKTGLLVGEDFWVDLVLHNESAAPLCSLDAMVRFDPTVFQAIDEDAGNWILLGVNAWDGAFHDSYPVDMHDQNVADNGMGTIRYKMGRSDTPWVFPTGIFARIHFRAIAPSEGSAISMVRNTRVLEEQKALGAYGLASAPGRKATDRPLPRVTLRVEPKVSASR